MNKEEKELEKAIEDGERLQDQFIKKSENAIRNEFEHDDL